MVLLRIRHAINTNNFSGEEKIKRKSIVLTTVLVVLQLCCSSLWARPTTAYEAEMVVTGWLKADPRPLDTALAPEVMMVETFTDDYGQAAYYIVYLQGPVFAGTQSSGFVIVSADDLVEPIIGFADDGIFDPSLDNPLGALVTNDLNGRIAAVRSTFSVLAMTPQAVVSKTQKKWRRFISLGEAPAGGFGLMGLTSISDVRVAPLVESKWGQGDVCNKNCYNYYTPNNYLCGCGATVMAQLMRYHQHPTTGIGIHEFTIKVKRVEQTAFTRGGDGNGGAYRWDLMVLEPGCSTTLEQRQAIGAICYDAGVATKTGYSAGGAGTDIWKVASALRNTFKYSNSVRSDDVGTGLTNMANSNLDADNPVIFCIWHDETEAGHFVVCDGYGYNASALYHHFNMGWRGNDDAWYNLPNIDHPSYNVVTHCVYNIFTSGSGEIISGRVTDISGNPISDAAVTAQGSGGPYTAVTNSKGIYALVRVNSGSTYTVSVMKSGHNFIPQAVTTGTSRNGIDVSGNRWQIDFVESHTSALEDFETGDFSKFPWEHAGDASWTVASRQKHSGAYSAQAGTIEDDGSTALKVTLGCISGNITFCRKVSSESGCDYLKFYIDGVEKDKWSDREDWAKVSFGVTAGTRTFEWTYSKDSSESGGDDTVWIDDIEFPVTIAPKIASNPYPADGAKFVESDVTLSWTGGFGAMLHTVYFGDDFDVVNIATGGAPTAATTYSPGPLELEKTYYWRVDEVEAHGTTIHKGDVWSFETIPIIPITDPHLIGWWKFDDEGSGTVVDYSGYDHHGTLRGDPQWVAGFDGEGLELDGDDYVIIDGYKGVLGTHAFSITAWIKTSYTRRGQQIVYYGTQSGGQRCEFRVHSDGLLRMGAGNGSVRSYTDLRDGQWHHIAVTIMENATNSSSDVRIYVDGEDDTQESTDTDAYNLVAGWDVTIGYRPSEADRPFIGCIDDVRLYNKALTQDEIRQAMRGDPLLARDP